MFSYLLSCEFSSSTSGSFQYIRLDILLQTLLSFWVFLPRREFCSYVDMVFLQKEMGMEGLVMEELVMEEKEELVMEELVMEVMEELVMEEMEELVLNKDLMG